MLVGGVVVDHGLAAASPVAAGVLGGLAVASDVAGAAASGATGTEIAAVAVFGVASWGIGGAGALVGASRISQAVVGGIYTAGGFGANYVLPVDVMQDQPHAAAGFEGTPVFVAVFLFIGLAAVILYVVARERRK
jgi:hypothetical protein